MTPRSPLTTLAVVLLTASSARGAAIEVKSYAWTDSPGGLSAVIPGDTIYYQIGVAVDPDFDPLGRPGVGNRGLATIVYDMISLEAEAQGIPIEPHDFAPSGYRSWPGDPPLAVTEDYMYIGGDGSGPWYNGGWGFDVASDLAGGNTTLSPGSVLGAGALMPLTWVADVDPLVPGLQPYARIDVGHGMYIFPADDPILGGLQGGFGMSIDNPNNLVEGDGTWVIKDSFIDTTGWAPGTYHYDLMPTNGAVLDGTLDYSDFDGTFRWAVNAADMAGSSFSFTILPEPATAALLLLGIAAVRPRRS